MSAEKLDHSDQLMSPERIRCAIPGNMVQIRVLLNVEDDSVRYEGAPYLNLKRLFDYYRARNQDLRNTSA
nr:hypothetical protein CFP56_11995 [Quercus suber]